MLVIKGVGMFHRASTPPNNNPPENGQENVSEKQDRMKFRNRVESSAVERYAKSQQDLKLRSNSANQNYNMPNTFQNNEQNPIIINKEKEVSPMNNPEPQAKNNSPEETKPAMPAQNRDVNIPGNNFQRPGMQPAGRPNYPGSYGASAVANNPYASSQNQRDNGRKLVIGQGITMSGEIESCEHLIVEGTIEATLKGASILDVYESGAFLGTVEIDEANIAGRFEGDITVKGRLTIESTGQVIGSISYKELSMEAGAVIDGSVSPIGSTNAAKKGATAPKAKKANFNNGAELPFSDKPSEAAE